MLVIKTGDGFEEASVGKTAQVSLFSPVHESQTVHLVGLTQQFFMMGARAVTSLLHVIVKQKPPIDRHESALCLADFVQCVHAGDPSGLLVVSRRCAGFMLMLKALNLHIRE